MPAFDFPAIRSSLILITNLDARGCSLRSLDGFLGVFAAGQRDAHAAVLERLGLGEDPEVDRPPGAPSASASAIFSYEKPSLSLSARITADADGPISSIEGIGNSRIARR